MKTGFLGMLSMDTVNKRKLFVLLALAAGLVSGCAAKTASVGPIFFPPPPDEPHVQYLTGITSSADFDSGKSGLTQLLVGGTETITKLSKPYGITAHNGKLYICDVGGSQVVVVDFATKSMKNLVDEPGSGRLQKPISVAVDDNDNVYVADNGRKDVVVYNPKGKMIKNFSQEFPHQSIVGVALYKDQLYVLDSKAMKISVLDKNTGELLTTIGAGEDKTKNLALPNGMTIDPKGNLHVVNMGNGTVKEYDRDGNMLSVFGRLGDFPGEFTRPRGLAVDDDGTIFVVDGGHQVVEVFNAEHRILGHFGQPGLMAGSLNLPAGVAISKDNLDLFQKFAAPGFKLQEVIFVTNQYSTYANYGLAVYGLGQMAGQKANVKAKTKEPATK